MTYRIPRQDMTMISPEAAFNNHWEARIPVPIADIEQDLSWAFHAGYAGLWPGMKIVVTTFSRVGTSWDTSEMQEEASYRVTRKDDDKIYLVRTSEVFTLKHEDAPPAPPEIRENYQIVEISPSAFEVQDLAGNSIEMFVERQQAEEFCDRENRRGLGGTPGLKIKREFAGRFKVEDSGGQTLQDGFTSKADAEAFIAGYQEPEAA